MVGVLYKLFPPTRSPEKELELEHAVFKRLISKTLLA